MADGAFTRTTMSVEVRVTAVLQKLTGGARTVQARGTTVGALLDDLDAAYPGFKASVMQDGKLHRFVNIYLNDEDIRYLDQLDTPVRDGDVVSILPAVAGGTERRSTRDE
jgi:molybdopterin synthase sulfur carrier subunit